MIFLWNLPTCWGAGRDRNPNKPDVMLQISFFKDLKFLSNRSFTFLVRVIPKYFMLFVAIVKGDASLISLSAYLFFVYRRAINFWS